jgi:predicted nucleic acid-binding protein
MKLPDAVVAATAIVYNFTLLSRNDKDFSNVQELQYFNPF